MKKYKITYDIKGSRSFQEITFEAKNEMELKFKFAEYLETFFAAVFPIYELYCFVNRKKDKVFNNYYNSFHTINREFSNVTYVIEIMYN